MNEADFLKRNSEAVGKLKGIRGHDLLILYWPDGPGSMVGADTKTLYSELRRVGWNRNSRVRSLDVLIHTYGGNPEAAYRMGQAVRDVAEAVQILVPEHSYSAGTLFCFCGDEIRLGDMAGLSPIDVRLVEANEPDGDGIDLLDVDYFREFAIDCRDKMQERLKEHGADAKTDVESQLLVTMVNQAGALNVGHFFRERDVTSEYARVLLNDYMLKERHDRKTVSSRIIEGLSLIHI